MAGENVIRKDVVQVSFDVDDSGLSNISGMIAHMTSSFDEVQRSINNATSEIAETTSEISELSSEASNASDSVADIADSAEEAADSVRDMANQADELRNSGADDLNDTIRETTDSAREASDSVGDLRESLENTTGRGIRRLPTIMRSSADAARNFASSLRANVVSGATNAVGKLKAKFVAAAEEARKVKEETEKSGDALETAKNAADGLKGAFGAAAGALGIGLGISQAVEGVSSLQSSMNKFQAQTGASAKEMEAYSASIKSLYTDAMGESMEDVADSMAIVKQTTGMVGKELEGTTRNALLMRDTFDFDVNESIRAVDMMMKQFGVDADTAYSMIAQGAQNGLNKNGDLLDTVNEYSVHFKQLGFSSEDMFNMLVNGAKSGTFSVDKLGDAVKEFGVRVVDGSTTTSEGFSAIGLDADEMAKRFKEGGETGKQAFAETVEALKAMEDPVAREAAGVALFGTMWEDLGAEGVFALSNITGEVTQTTDALNKINEVRYNDVGAALEAIKRKIGVGLNTALTPVLNKVIQLINKFQEWANKANLVDKIKAAFERVKEAVTPVIATIGSVIGKIYEFATAESTINAVKTAFEKVKSVVEPIVDVVKRIIDRIIELATAESTVNTLKTAFEKIKEVLGDISSAAEKVFNFISDNIEWILPLVEGLVIAFAAFKAVMLVLKAVQIAYNVVMAITNAIMAVSPITWIILAIGVLIGIIILCIKYWDNIKAAMQSVWDKIKEVFGKLADWFKTNVVDPIVSFFEPIIAKVKAFLSKVTASIKSAIAKIVGVVQSIISHVAAVINKIIQIVAAIVLKIGEIIAKIWEIITTILGVIASWVYNTIIQPVVAFITGLWNTISGIVTGIWNSIVAVFSVIASWVYANVISPIISFFQTMWDAITGVFSAIGSWFSEKFSEAVEAIKSVFSTVVEFFTGLWNNIKEIFTTIGTAIGNGIADAFATVVNAIINFAENTINGFIRAINAAIGLINKIPGVSISTISELSIPRLAKGGVVDKPTIAEIGEDGKEAVVPLENNLGWIRRIIKGVTDSIAMPKNNAPSYVDREVVSSSKSEYNENNSYNPTFVLNMNGASATDDNKRKVKQWIKESMKEMFDDLDRDNRPIVEV